MAKKYQFGGQSLGLVRAILLRNRKIIFVMAYALQECYDLADVTYQFRLQDDLRIGGDEKAWGLNWSYEDLDEKMVRSRHTWAYVQ